jgi:tetratricopeptide (TPR) repeat protein
MKPFDVAISFAGEDRGIANQLAQLLKASGLLIFYDDDERSQLLGENLFEYLIEIYKNQASYCVILVSKDYVKKRWPRHEFHAVQARVFEQFDQAYMLPIRIDNADLPGLLSTVGHLSLKSMSIQEAAIIIREKIKGTARINTITRSADVAFRKGDYSATIRKLSDPSVYASLQTDCAALRLLADAYMHLGENDLAIPILERVLSCAPDDVETIFLLGVCEFRQRRFRRAVISLQKAAECGHQTAAGDLRRARWLARIEGIPFAKGFLRFWHRP